MLNVVYKVKFKRRSTLSDKIEPIYFRDRTKAVEYAKQFEDGYYICVVSTIILN